MEIQRLTQEHAGAVLDMMREFYSSPAVLTDGSEEIFERNVAECLDVSSNLDGYVFVCEDGQCAGYAMTTRTYITEFGRQCIWVEDLYVKTAYQGRGFGSQFLSMLQEQYPKAVLRLEAEEENTGAIELYKRHGFRLLPYVELIHLPDAD